MLLAAGLFKLPRGSPLLRQADSPFVSCRAELPVPYVHSAPRCIIELARWQSAVCLGSSVLAAAMSISSWHLRQNPGEMPWSSYAALIWLISWAVK